jgi:hypothetical protein
MLKGADDILLTISVSRLRQSLVPSFHDYFVFLFIPMPSSYEEVVLINTIPKGLCQLCSPQH